MQLLVLRTGLVFQGPAQTPTPLRVRNWPRRPGSACRAGCWAPRIWLMMAWFRGYTPADSAPLMFRVLRLPLPLPRRVPQRLLEPRQHWDPQRVLSFLESSKAWIGPAWHSPPLPTPVLSCPVQSKTHTWLWDSAWLYFCKAWAAHQELVSQREGGRWVLTSLPWPVGLLEPPTHTRPWK